MPDLTKLLTDTLAAGFAAEPPQPALFDPATDLLLALVAPTADRDTDDLALHFREYFVAGQMPPIEGPAPPRPRVLGDLIAPVGCAGHYPGTWPVPDPCLAVDGRRGTTSQRLTRLFAGDLLWLYFMERMGVFQIVGSLLDDYALLRRFPLASRRRATVVVEAMVRDLRAGVSSTTRDRDVAYRTCLGWTSELGATLGSEAQANRAFSIQFHRLIRLALQFYSARQLAVAIKDAASPARASTATLIAIRDTLRILQKTCETFEYGRTYTTTLNGIVWVIGSLAVVRDLRRDLGIADMYEQPYEYVPAAYDLLVRGDGKAGQPDPTRYFANHECANTGRDLMLDVQVLPVEAPNFAATGGLLEAWLDLVEQRVEGYRTAYHALTQLDLSAADVAAPQLA
jgi:hypothetical protein